MYGREHWPHPSLRVPPWSISLVLTLDPTSFHGVGLFLRSQITATVERLGDTREEREKSSLTVGVTSETGHIPTGTSAGEANDGVDGDSLKVQIQCVQLSSRSTIVTRTSTAYQVCACRSTYHELSDDTIQMKRLFALPGKKSVGQMSVEGMIERASDAYLASGLCNNHDN